MRKLILIILFVGSIILMLAACGEGPEGEDQGASATVSKHSLIKEPTRPHPGWACSSHPNVKSYYPGTCPIDKLPLERQGGWTCPNHPQVSATAPGKCPIDNVPLVKVEELEKKTGKSIDELTREALEQAKKAE